MTQLVKVVLDVREEDDCDLVRIVGVFNEDADPPPRRDGWTRNTVSCVVGSRMEIPAFRLWRR